MIRAFSGGWDAMSAALGMTRTALENRIYEYKGMRLHVHTALEIQRIAGTTHFAEAIASASGGTFVQLPPVDELDNDSIHAAFNETYEELGHMFRCFREITEDGVIDESERARMQQIGRQMHKRTEALMGLMFAVYCPRTGMAKLVQESEVHNAQ